MRYSKVINSLFKKMEKIENAELNEKEAKKRWPDLKSNMRNKSSKLQQDLFEDMYRMNDSEAIIILNSFDRAKKDLTTDLKYQDIHDSIKKNEIIDSIRTLDRLSSMLSIVTANNMIGLAIEAQSADKNNDGSKLMSQFQGLDTAVFINSEKKANRKNIVEENDKINNDNDKNNDIVDKCKNINAETQLKRLVVSLSDNVLDSVRNDIYAEKEIASEKVGSETDNIIKACDLVDSYIVKQLHMDSIDYTDLDQDME